MTRNRDLKNEIRAHQNATGAKFTVARREVLARKNSTAAAECGRAMQPGTITAILSGGGQNNFAMTLPRLGELLAAGHPLVHNTAGRDGLMSLPGDFDFAIQLGLTDAAEVVGAFADDIGRTELLTKIEPMMRGITRLESPCARQTLVDLLSRRGPDGQAAVLWVQDFDDGGPVALSSSNLRYRDELAVQMPALRAIADDTGAVIALGHLDHDLDQREEWWSIPKHANTTFVSAHEWEDPNSTDSWRVFEGTADRGLVRGQGPIDLWRSALMERRRAA